MQVLIINLAASTARMAFQVTQMAALGLSWRRLEATTPETLPIPFDDPYWQRWERPMRAAEMALFASHRRAWQQVAASRAPRLIIEDDALLAADTPALLRALLCEEGIDHVNLEVRSRRKLVGRKHPSLAMRRLYQDRTGAAAYALWPSGARKLFARTAARPGLSDAIISATYELRSWQADPALAMQIDQCGLYGLAPPIRTESSLANAPSPPPGGGRHRLRRISSQLRMGLRHLAKCAEARRRWIAPSARWPALPPEGGAPPGRGVRR